MSKDLTQAVREYREWKLLISEAEERIESLKDVITSEMNERGLEKMTVDVFKVSNITITTNKLDKKALKKDHEQIYNNYMKPSSYKRFTVV